MNTITQKMIEYFANKPAAIFMLDGLGAALTSLSLFVISRNFAGYFGLPEFILTYLSLPALALCIYSALCFFFLKAHWSPFLKTIAMGNCIYCIMTVLMMYGFFNTLSPLGLNYFLAEITIILALVYVELKLARRFEIK